MFVAGTSGNRGFTLIELAIAMIVSSLMMLAILKFYEEYKGRQAVEHTMASQKLLSASIKQFLYSEDRYPCPANPRARPGDINYGREDCSGANIIVATAAGIDRDGDGVDDQVLIGAIPFNDLYDSRGLVPLTLSNAIDGWDNQFTYAVTRNLTDAAKYNKENGVIDVVDEYNVSVTFPEKRTHYVLVSHGPNGFGAYARDGGQSVSCTPIVIPPGTPSTVVTAKNERENCNGDAIFMSGIRRDGEFAKYDDYIGFYNTKDMRLWVMVGDNKARNTNIGNVGINAPAPTQKLEVGSNLRAGIAMSKEVCDQSGLSSTCMPVNVLSGGNTNMACPTDQAVTKIAGNQLRTYCTSYKIDRPRNKRCDPGQIMVGYSAKDDQLLCAPRP